jgi:hypothetical protein
MSRVGLYLRRCHSISWCEMAGAATLAGTIVALALAGGPAAAAADNAAPRILSAKAAERGERLVRVVVTGRDRDDVVRGAEVSWGEAQPAQGLSACEQSSRRSDRRRRGRRERFVLTHEYAAAGRYTITVRVLSGGCGDRPQQRSAARTLTVHVE